jgi:hypothetical protein
MWPWHADKDQESSKGSAAWWKTLQSVRDTQMRKALPGELQDVNVDRVEPMFCTLWGWQEEPESLHLAGAEE